MAKPTQCIILRRPDNSVAIVYPMRTKRRASPAVLDADGKTIITPAGIAETNKQYLDDVLADTIAGDPDLAGAVEVARGNPAVLVPLDRTNRKNWRAPGGVIIGA